MYSIIADIQYINASNCFAHLSPYIYSKINNSLTRCFKGLVVKTQATIYLSFYSDANINLADNVIGLSPLYASSLGLSPGDKVVFTPLDSISSISKLNAQPLSSNDREILEIAAGDVEASLLNQLRIVWPNQCFPIWVSPTITVRLVVDSIYPEAVVGQLEEHTELIVGGVKRTSRIITEHSNDSCHTSSHNNECNLVEDVLETNIPKKLEVDTIIVRLVPHHDINSPPYHAILTQLDCPDWLKSSEDGTVFQLTSCYEPFDKVFITVSVVTSSLPDIGSYKSLSVSQTVIDLLSSDCGSKGLLTRSTPPLNELNSLLITPCPTIKDKYPLNEVEQIFRNELSSVCIKWGRCLLNTKGNFPLNDNSFVSVTLRPLDLEWAQITLLALYNLPISVTSFVASIKDDEKENKLNLNLVSKNVVGPLIPITTLLLDHSLNLSRGLTTNVAFRNNFLLVGKHGSGKTCISNKILDIISKYPYYIHFEKIDCTTLKGKRIENVGKIFQSHLNTCQMKQPAILLIDNIGTICGTFSPEHENSESSFHIERISQKVADMLNICSLESSVLIFATCDNISSINSSLFKRRGKSTFSTVLSIEPLTQEEKVQLIEDTIINKTLNSKESLKDLNIDYFSSLMESYLAGDITRFVEKAMFQASQRSESGCNGLVLIKDDLDRAYESNSEFIHSRLKVQRHHHVTLSHVGGLKDVKEKLNEVILWPSKFGSLLNQCPLRKQTGILLYGPPGSGKTLIARAIANESSLNFITIKGPELMSKYIGESEEGVRRVFENAQAAKPSLLFFDEFESLAPRRGEEETGVTDRVVNQLLTALDGVEPMSGVIVMAASSRPDLIDPALLRSGRLSHHLYCSYPNVEERVDILKILTQSLVLDCDVDLNIIADQTEDFSGADLKGLLATAQIQFLDRLGNTNSLSDIEKSESCDSQAKIGQADLISALDQTRPSLTRKDRLRFDNIYKSFSKGKVQDVTSQRAIFA